MATFEFFVDVKYTYWNRQYFSVEAETEEEAKLKAIDSVKENDYEVNYSDDLDAFERLSTEDNGGYSTEDLFFKGQDSNLSNDYQAPLFWKNGK